MTHAPLPVNHPDHDALWPVVDALLRRAGGWEGLAAKVPDLFRLGIDEVIDTPRSNRFTIEEIEKTEKTYLGTKMEILLRNYLQFPKGQVLDLNIAGVEVDIKNTMGRAWTIPQECFGQIALLLRSNEKTALCDLGLILVRHDYLNLGRNRDLKTTLTAQSLANVWWLLKDHPYPKNFWLDLGLADRMAIQSAGGATKRLAALFERLQNRPIGRTQILGLAQQLDAMKRLRNNGGARDVLRSKGIVILSGNYDRDLIKRLGLPTIKLDEFVSYRPSTDDQSRLLQDAGLLDRP